MGMVKGVSEWVSSFLLSVAHQHIIGCLQPDGRMESVTFVKYDMQLFAA